MKPITNILLIAVLVCYVFLPFYEVSLEGSWTGLRYTAETITSNNGIITKLMSVLLFVSCIVAIAFNCLKHRYWGLVVTICTLAGIYFYYASRNIEMAANPDFFSITGLGYGFNVGFWLMIAAAVSSILSVMPFAWNMIHELEENITHHHKK